MREPLSVELAKVRFHAFFCTIFRGVWSQLPIKYLITMKKNLFLGLLLCSMFMFSSCENDGLGTGLTGYYTDLSYVAKTQDFNEINEAINNNELLSSYKYGGERHNYYATYDLFIEDGRYSDSNAHFGRLRFSINYPIIVIQIVDKSTIKIYNPMLYKEGYGDGEDVYKLYAGPIFGNLVYNDEPSYYTYTYIATNKIALSNGDIYTIVDGGLIEDGSSNILSKYDPTKLHK